MQQAIPRFLIAQPGRGKAASYWFAVDVPAEFRSALAFSTAEQAEEFIESSYLGKKWKATELSEGKLLKWLELIRKKGCALLVLNPASLNASVVYAAEIPLLVDTLAYHRGMDVEFEPYLGIPLS